MNDLRSAFFQIRTYENEGRNLNIFRHKDYIKLTKFLDTYITNNTGHAI